MGNELPAQRDAVPVGVTVSPYGVQALDNKLAVPVAWPLLCAVQGEVHGLDAGLVCHEEVARKDVRRDTCEINALSDSELKDASAEYSLNGFDSFPWSFHRVNLVTDVLTKCESTNCSQ